MAPVTENSQKTLEGGTPRGEKGAGRQCILSEWLRKVSVRESKGKTGNPAGFKEIFRKNDQGELIPATTHPS